MKDAQKNFRHSWLVAAGIALIVIVVAIIIWLFAKSETTTTGYFPSNTKTTNLSCQKDDIDYPFFANNGATSKKATINSLFNKDELKTISLQYIVTFKDSKNMKLDASLSQAAMNQSFSNVGLDADAFWADYSSNGNSYTMSLYAPAEDFKENAKKYFYANNLSANDNIDTFEENFVSQGFYCIKK